MKKIAIPTILTATLLIASIFAFMPVYKASTVHTTIIASVAKEVAVTTTKTGLTPPTTTITCATTSAGCQIQEIFLAVTGGGTASVTLVTFSVAGAAASTVGGATLTGIASGSAAAIPAVGGLAIGPGDTVVVTTTGSTTATGQTLRVVGLVTGAAPALTVA